MGKRVNPLSFIFVNKKAFVIGKINFRAEAKNKHMEETKCTCAECERRAQEEKETEEMNFAVLLALVPALVVTLLSNVGLL